jgi:hypothetical protein
MVTVIHPLPLLGLGLAGQGGHITVLVSRAAGDGAGVITEVIHALAQVGTILEEVAHGVWRAVGNCAAVFINGTAACVG